jgi:hypothetical protein
MLNTSATINLQTSTSYEFGFITSQKQAIVRYINRICQTSKWNVEEEFLKVLFGGRNADESFESTFMLLLGPKSFGELELTNQYRSEEGRWS